jgi:hypothetical protein
MIYVLSVVILTVNLGWESESLDTRLGKGRSMGVPRKHALLSGELFRVDGICDGLESCSGGNLSSRC